MRKKKKVQTFQNCSDYSFPVKFSDSNIIFTYTNFLMLKLFLLVQDELDRFNITDAKYLIKKMEEGKLSKSTNNLAVEPDDKATFKNKVNKMQTNKALGKLLCNVGEERFNRLKKEKMEAQMGFNHVTRTDLSRDVHLS